MKDACKIIVFAKAPVAGFAKTRLIPALGAEAAAQLATRMLHETVQQAVAAVGAMSADAVELCCAPDITHPAFSTLQQQYGIELSAQGEGDLGQRMWRALQRALQQYQRVVLIGTDAPALHAPFLQQAATVLQTHQAVFAPAFDGGYVLVGLSQALPTLFQDIAWSTTAVMQQTRARLQVAGASYSELPTLHDIDEAEDLAHVPAAWLVAAAGS
jgi:hypothetical protein